MDGDRIVNAGVDPEVGKHLTHPIAFVHLNHEKVEHVLRARPGSWQDDVGVGEQRSILRRVRDSSVVPGVKMAELNPKDRRLQLIQPRVPANVDVLVLDR
jgi:hypothetical protein